MWVTALNIFCTLFNIFVFVCVCMHVPSVWLVCFAVDVHHSAWSYCHECCYGSGQHTRGSCRAGPTWSRTGTCCCCREEKMMAASMFSHTVGIIIRLTIVTLFSVFLGMVSILPWLHHLWYCMMMPSFACVETCSVCVSKMNWCGSYTSIAIFGH